MSMNLTNKTSYQAYFTVLKGDLVVVEHIPVSPDALAELSTDLPPASLFATTTIEGNTYTTATQSFVGAAGFLAQVKQVPQQGTYDFELVNVGYSHPNQLQLQKTCIGPVIFSLRTNDHVEQNVVVTDNFVATTLNINDTYSIYAVINGVTTEAVQTNNPQATITAVVDTTSLESGYFTLVVS
ncbi:hypothetical protein ACO0K9_22060 [Undibacterium sp. Ji50W]|uniref:hypothetical protein n=1 Tax=Undibacterium sp. Ji50W TaxID=3413041 RepID=UPI003BEF98BE